MIYVPNKDPKIYIYIVRIMSVYCWGAFAYGSPREKTGGGPGKFSCPFPSGAFLFTKSFLFNQLLLWDQLLLK